MFKKPKGRKRKIQVFYLKRKNEAVQILEVDKIDFHDVKSNVEGGESVFITSKTQSKISI